MSFNRRDQCASFEPLVVYFGKGPLTAGQSGLSALVVDGPKTYDTMVQDNPGKNASEASPAEKTIERKRKREKDSSNAQTYDVGDMIRDIGLLN